MKPALETILNTLKIKGGEQYGGEAVTQLEHQNSLLLPYCT